MISDISLVEQFDRSKVADEIRSLVGDAVIINGSNALYSNQQNITDYVSSGEAIYQWEVHGKADVLLMSEKHAAALLNLSDMPLIKDRMQYPAGSFERARSGEVALGMTKERTPMVVMMNKIKVLDLIDPLARHEKNMQDVIHHIQDFMRDRGLSPVEMKNIIDGLEKQYPKPSLDSLA